MNKVITINLNGNAYQLEEPGYELLQTYLSKAAAKLADNPDKDQIVADFEQAIADKCAKYVRINKNVVTTQEIETILAQMGPVHDDETTAEATAESIAPTDAPKRLFRIRQGAMIEGVCNGFAVYFNVDPTIMRILFVILTILTGGAWAAAYVIMVFIIPEAKTREDIAKAKGQELNAQTLMQNAKERYEYWKKFGQDQAEQWNKTHPKGHEHANVNPKQAHATATQEEIKAKAMPTLEQIDQWHDQNHNPVLRAIAGIFGAIGVLLTVAMGTAWIMGIVHIINSGTFLGYFQGAPVWMIALLFSCAFYLVFIPLQGLVAQAFKYAANKSSYNYTGFWGTFTSTMLWLAAAGGIAAIVMSSPQIHEGLQQIKHDYEHTQRIGR